MLKSYLDFVLPFAAVNQSPAKKICDRRAASAATSQIVCPKTTSKDRPLPYGYPDPFNPKIGFFVTMHKTAIITQEFPRMCLGINLYTTGNGIIKLRENNVTCANNG